MLTIPPNSNDLVNQNCLVSSNKAVLSKYGAIVVGGGFYGCSLALYLRQFFDEVLVIERLPQLLGAASYANQARVHQGYHYPRSLATAYSSRLNFTRFMNEFKDCIDCSFTKLYCVARNNSKINSRQFERFCSLIGAPCKPAAARFERLFEPRLIQAVYEVEEYAFDAKLLRGFFEQKLEENGVHVLLNTKVQSFSSRPDHSIEVVLENEKVIRAFALFNCTYSGLRHIQCSMEPKQPLLKHEIAEIALIDPPPELKSVGVTVMDGPFFSTMPFPARGLHSLSHVRYTPHASWLEKFGSDADPYSVFANHPKQSKVLHMIRDAQRYLPIIANAKHVDSLFVIKSILARNEIDDGRPILLERSGFSKNAFHVMGGKMDNIYDVFQALDAENVLGSINARQ